MSTIAITNSSHPKIQSVEIPASIAGATLNDLLQVVSADFLLVTLTGSRIDLGARTLERLAQIEAAIRANWHRRNGPTRNYGLLRTRQAAGATLLSACF